MKGKVGILLLIAAYLSCTQMVAVLLTPSPRVSVREGQTVTLDCELEREDKQTLSWYKQFPAEGPQFILNFHPWNSSVASYGAGFFSSKFIVTQKDSLHQQLVIRNVSMSDTALYYCALGINQSSHGNIMRTVLGVCCCLAVLMRFLNGQKPTAGNIIFGEGIQLIVEGPYPSNPSVVIFPPSPDELRTSGTASLVCLVRGLSLSLVDISWGVNGKAVNRGVSISPPSRDQDGTFSQVSLLSIPITSWNKNDNYSCSAKQGSRIFKGTLQASRC
ncbi:immunoglobulin lambda-1 light chain [Amia ocellicauda]|uniref:immunoglobulin lambda-1 light chain n=1 Tax=Amia ocellicauda TaxID=2972642 RepID=UPI003463954A